MKQIVKRKPIQIGIFAETLKQNIIYKTKTT